MDSLNRDILRLSIPTIISNITVPLLGICDTAIAGHLGSENFLAAIAVGSVMLNVVFWIFGFLRGGTTGLTANALGAGNQNEISRVLYRALIIAGVAGALMIIFQKPLFKGLWWVAGAGPEILPDVGNYFIIRIWGSPALLATMAISGWFVGMQNTFYPMVIAIVMNLLNIAFSFSLVWGAGLGFPGVAWGTLIANWLGLITAIGCMMVFLKGSFPKTSLVALVKGQWWKYFSVNGNLFLRSFFIICVTMGVTYAGGKIGYMALAVNVIVMQFFQFFSFFMDGFAFSGEAIVGLRAGEKNMEMLEMSVSRLLKWALATGVVFSLFYFFGTSSISSLLTDSGEVIERVSELNFIISLIPIISCWAFIYDGFYIGITDTMRMMVSTLLGALIFFGLILLNLNDINICNLDRNLLLWVAFLAYLGVRGIFLALCWPQSLKISLKV